MATVCSRHFCSLGSEAGASRRTAPKGQHEAQAVGRGRWGPAGCFGLVELGLFAEDLERPQEGEDTAGEVRLGRRVGPGQGRMEPQIPLLIFANGVPSLVPLAGAAVAQVTHWHPGPCAPRHQAYGPTGAWPWLTSGQSTCHTEDRGRGVNRCGCADGLPFQSSVGNSAHSLGTRRASPPYGCVCGAEGLTRGQRRGRSPGRGRESRHCGPAGAGRGQSSG